MPYHKSRPLPVLTESQTQNFWSKVDKTTEDKCWNWLAHKNEHGYGSMRISEPRATPLTVKIVRCKKTGRIKGTAKCGGTSPNHAYKTHRLAYFLSTGKDPHPREVLHKCDNPACCNPDHLFLGTAEENMQDKVHKGRHRSKKPVLTPNQVRWARYQIGGGHINQSQAARALSVHQSTISDIMTGRCWSHLK